VNIVAAEKAKAEPVAEVETRVVETDPELPLPCLIIVGVGPPVIGSSGAGVEAFDRSLSRSY
jgi:hypothetical protein